MNFTPGPWKAEETFDDNESNGIQVIGDGDVICSIYGIGRHDFSNAACIAAAPDMYAALKRALAVLDGSGASLTKEIRAALKKAEGL